MKGVISQKNKEDKQKIKEDKPKIKEEDKPKIKEEDKPKNKEEKTQNVIRKRERCNLNSGYNQDKYLEYRDEKIAYQREQYRKKKEEQYKATHNGCLSGFKGIKTRHSKALEITSKNGSQQNCGDPII